LQIIIDLYLPIRRYKTYGREKSLLNRQYRCSLWTC